MVNKLIKEPYPLYPHTLRRILQVLVPLSSFFLFSSIVSYIFPFLCKKKLGIQDGVWHFGRKKIATDFILL
jgi:hypothetical protein